MQFTVTFTEPYVRMVKRIKSAPAKTVFLMLPQYLSFTEFRIVRQDDVAEELNLSQAAVSKALNELAHLGAIERQGSGTATKWRLSMEWGWQGSVKSFHAERARRAAAPKVAKLKRPKLSIVSDGPSAA